MSTKALEGYELGPQQRRLWQLQDGSNPFRAVAVVEISGDVDGADLRSAVDELIGRNDILRTSFHRRAGMRVPIQVVDPVKPSHWKETDLRGMTMSERTERLRQISTGRTASGKDPGFGCGVTVDIVKLDGRHSMLAVTVSSLCADSWAVASLTRQMCEGAYTVGGATRYSDAEFQYFQYAQWQNELLESDEDEGRHSREYWATQGSHSSIVALPLEKRVQVAGSFDPATVGFELSTGDMAAAESVASRFKLTPQEVWAACWALLIRRLSGKPDIVIWQTIDGRRHEELQEAIGLYAKSVPIQVRIDCTSTFAALLPEWSSLARETYSLQDSYDPAWPDLEPADYPIGFEYVNGWTQAQCDTTYRLVALTSCIDSFKLKLSCLESGGVISAQIHYDPRVYDRITVELIARWFTGLTYRVLRSTDTPMDRLELLCDIEKHRRTIELNDTAAPDLPAECVHRLFEDRMEVVPDAIAAVFEDRFLTYRELNRRANRLAYRLLSMNVGPDRLVGLLMGRSLESLIGILGVLKSGGAYVPLDPAYPRKRLAGILESIAAEILVTSSDRIPADIEFAGSRIIINDDYDESSDEWDSNPAPAITPQNLVYVIFTSGSTGIPKGVAVNHECLLNYVCGISNRLAFPAQARFATVSTFAADLGNTMIYPSLVGGGCLHIIPVDRATDPARLRDYFLRHNIDCLKIVPSHLSALLASGNFPLPSRRLIIGGETLRSSLIDDIFQLGADCTIFNHYGPTETTVGVFTHPVLIRECSAAAAPIGRPLPAVTGYVLDEGMHLAPLGVPGELFIGGGTVARGYLNRPELTAGKFVPDPFAARQGARLYRTGDRARSLPDGAVEFLGRADDQIKFHGHRVEMNEIRTALNRHPLVKDSVVSVASDEKANDVLIACYVARQEIEVSELRSCLRESLLEEIIPNLFVHLQRLPLTTNGKLDHAALPGVEEARKLAGRSSAQPGTLIEELVAGIWAEVLGLERVGVDDNFFNLGGHSLLATQVISRVRDVLTTEVSLRALFESPTVAAFSAAVERERQGGTSAHVVPIRAASRDRDIPLSFAQQRLWFIHQLDPGSAAYNIPRAMRLRGPLVVSALQQSLTALVARHEVLRTTFQASGGRPFQVIGAAAEVEMPMWDATTLSDADRRKRTDEIVGLEAIRPFSLEHGPLVRAALARLSPDEHVLLLTLHHVISDGWSTGVLVEELTALYEGYSNGQPVGLAELPVQYADFAVWQREQIQGEVLEEQLSYWRRELAGLPQLEFPDGRSHLPMSSPRSATVPFGVSRELTAELKGMSRREGVTLFMAILAAFQIILGRFAQKEDVAVGISVAGRNRRETEGLIGFFVNQLVLRADLSGDPTFRKVLEQARRKTLAAYARQDVPFEKLVEEIAPERSMSRNPLFQVKLVFQNAPERRTRLAALKVEPFEEVTSEAKFDLLFIVGELRGRLAGAFYAGAHVFPRGYVEMLNAEMQELLRLVGSGSDLPLSSLRAELDQFSNQYRESRKLALTSAFEKTLSRQRQTRIAARLAPVGE